MKTIQELNSKWYWRLIKVIYALGFFTLIGISAFLYFELFQKYNPEKIDSAIKYIDKEFEKNEYIKINESLTGTEYSIDLFRKKLKGDNIEGDKLRQLLVLILASGKNIEGVKTCLSSSIVNCPSSDWFIEKIINENSIPCDSEHRDCVNFDTTIYILKESVDIIINARKEIENDFQELKNSLILLKEERISYIYNEYTLSEKYNLDINYGYKDYLGSIGWIKIISSFLGTVIGLILFTLFSRGIIYYIILGKFNPEK